MYSLHVSRTPIRFGRIVTAISTAGIALMITWGLLLATSGTVGPDQGSCEAVGGTYEAETGTCIFVEELEIVGELSILTDTIIVLEDDVRVEYEIVYGMPIPYYGSSLFDTYGAVANNGSFVAVGSEIRNSGVLTNAQNLAVYGVDKIMSDDAMGPFTSCAWTPGELVNFGQLYNSGEVRLTGAYYDNWGQFTNSEVLISRRGYGLCTYRTGYFRNSGHFTNTGLYEQHAVFYTGHTLNLGTVSNLRTMHVSDGVFRNEGILVNQETLEISDMLTNTGTVINSGQLINKGVVINHSMLYNSGTLRNYGSIIGDIYNTGLILNSGSITGTASGPGSTVVLTHHMHFPVLIYR